MIMLTNKEKDFLLKELRIHVFGSLKNYYAYRNSGKIFPAQYKDISILIAHGNFNRETISLLIASAIKASIELGFQEQKENREDTGLRCERISTGTHIQCIVDRTQKKENDKGKRIRRYPANPRSEATFKNRLGSRCSKMRSHNYTEEQILQEAILYTKKYNERFGTDFDVFVNKARKKN